MVRLDKWRAARDGAAKKRAELVLFGDSTAFGSSGSPVVPWIYRVRALSAAAGYKDGGRGNISWADAILKPAPNEPADTPNSIVSKTGFGGSNINGTTSLTYFDSKVRAIPSPCRATASRSVCTYQTSWVSGVFSYAVDGAPATKVSAFYPSGVRPAALLDRRS